MFLSQDVSILYIDNDAETRENNAAIIRKNGLHVLTANNTARAYDLYQIHTFDIIIINLPLLNENGLDFIRHLRQLEITVPIIITAESTEKEILLDAINLDISRYLIKPFDHTALLEALESTAKKLPSRYGTTFVNLHNGFSYDTINKSVNRPNGTTAQLTQKEYLLLELLLENKRKIVPYETIESILWHTTTMSINALRTLVRAIRKKTYQEIIENNNSIGYKIDL